MKSAYEIAMERLGKQSAPVKLTAKQKEELAELDRVYKAKVAERELATRDEMNAAADKGEISAMDEAESRWKEEKPRLTAEWEAKREAVRNARK
ncbi:MAG: hypothetical protein HY301_06875 [Verrucomicrobia bacterium]|nr:hypothetical protein [Verrucomicrobiota bacterium]